MRTELTFGILDAPPPIEARYARNAELGHAILAIGPLTIHLFAEDLAGARERFRALRAALDHAERDFLDAEAPALAELRAEAIAAAAESDDAAAEFTARRVNEQLGSAA